MLLIYTIKKAWKVSKDGIEIPSGYNLYCNDEWCNFFYLKRDAKAIIDEEIKKDPLNTKYKP